MKGIKGLITSILVLSVSACASMYTPDSNLIDTLPVVKIGEKKPESKDYILYIPAKTEFPVHFSVKGDLIAQPVEQEPKTRIKKDLYIYKYWSSLDGRNWQPSRELIQMPIGIGVGPEGGQVHVKINLVSK